MRDEHQARLGTQIATLRERQGWSQRALAKWMGLDQSAVSRIEAGRRRVSAEELHRFADALHVTADVLLSGEPPAGSMAEPHPDISQALDSSSGPPEFEEIRFRAAMPADMEPPLSSSRAARSASGAMMEDAGFERLLSGQSRLPAVSAPAIPASGAAPALGNVPAEVAAVTADWLRLRALAADDEPAQRWSTGHSAEGKPERLTHPSANLRPGLATGDVLYDRVARFWRSELHVEPDDGPLPDLVPLLEDGYGAQVIVARVARRGSTSGEGVHSAAERPVAAAFTSAGVPFIFVNAARPVLLQRFALAHAFAHLVLGHGDVTDQRIEWSRNVPPEAAANDFAEEFLAPVRAVQRWYERREVSRWVRLEDLLDLGNAFGISAWSALFRSRAAGRLQGKQFHTLRSELKQHEWELLPRQAYLGGIRDTLTHLTPGDCLPAGRYGGPAVLRVPAAMRSWALAALEAGRLSVEEAAGFLRVEPSGLAEQLARLGLE
jgi:transcriptional regulator with XRE-family HTH domain/Zn-dependent peptidase ImmA (M78 family)